MDKRIKICLKLFVSLVILCLLFFTVDVNTCLKTLSHINISLFFLLVLIYLTGQVISAVKWKIIAQKLGFHNTLFNFIKYYFKGMFYNSFLPTNVGGDIMKIAYLKKDCNQENSIEKAFVSVLADRISGVFVLVILAFAGILAVHNLNNMIKFFVCLAFLLSLLSIFLILVFGKKNFKHDIINKIIGYNKLFLYIDMFKILFLSLVFHILVIILHVLIGKALHLTINPFYYLILYPLSALAASLPVSLNGIGIKEASYMYLLAQVSILPSQALIFVLCWNLVILINSLIGAMFFIEKTD